MSTPESSMDDAIFRLWLGGRARLAVGPANRRADWRLLAPEADFTQALVKGDLTGLFDFRTDEAVPRDCRVLAPIEEQDVWAAGVTYRSSRMARVDESSAPDVYTRLWDAQRPELFFKAAGGRVVGPEDAIGVRHDSSWNVPEPELTLVLSPAGRLVGLTIGNDVSSRAIEGENPLYLPQAKIYDRSCALGPGVVPVDGEVGAYAIRLDIERNGDAIVSMETSTAEMVRTFDELAGYAFSALSHPAGLFLMTGTCLVPPPEHTLRPGDVVRITVPGVGELRNPVVEV
ncbi:MAG: fumarylacetoacetate hydrolase family protein [Tetrasphaera sp.]|nr:fumarylacetoacetate hydrolase family protein [Tetrasphaera sp.]